MASSSLLTCTPSIGIRPMPFRSTRSFARATVQKPRLVAAQAAKEPNKLVQSTIAAVAAASIAVAGPAFATGAGIMPERNRAEDTAARNFMDSQEKKGPAVQNRSADPNSGNVNTYDMGGVAQADARQPAGRYPKSDPNHVVSDEDQVASLPASRGPGAGGKADEKLDPAAALKFANSRTKPVAYTFDTASLQVLVDDQTFGRGEIGTMRDQVNNTADKVKETAANPVQKAGQEATKAKRAADDVFSNPFGTEQSKEAAANIADANAEVPKALQKGFSDLKRQLTEPKPSSFDVFSVSKLQHSANMEASPFNTSALQHNVRVGDLQSITGGQAKKAGPDSKIKPSSTGGADGQLITNESTSGVKARGASGTSGKGAADRAAARVDKLTNDKTAIP